MVAEDLCCKAVVSLSFRIFFSLRAGNSDENRMKSKKGKFTDLWWHIQNNKFSDHCIAH